MKVHRKKKILICKTNYKKKMHNNNSKFEQQKSKVISSSKIGLNNLPLEILEKIISNIPIWHRNRIRSTSKILKYASDSLLLHELRNKIANFQKDIAFKRDFALMKAIHQGTWAFIKSGFGSIFLGKMLVLLRKNYNNKFVMPTIENCKKFLRQFYDLIYEKVGITLSRNGRILYILTLLGYFQNIKRCEKMFSEYENGGHWQIIYILHGSWFYIYTNNNSLRYVEDGNNLLICLFCLMYASYMEESFRNLYETNYKAYLIGYDARVEANIKTFIIFNVFSTKSMFEFFLSASKTEKWTEFPDEEFQVEVELFTRQSTKKYSSYHLII